MEKEIRLNQEEAFDKLKKIDNEVARVLERNNNLSKISTDFSMKSSLLFASQVEQLTKNLYLATEEIKATTEDVIKALNAYSELTNDFSSEDTSLRDL